MLMTCKAPDVCFSSRFARWEGVIQKFGGKMDMTLQYMQFEHKIPTLTKINLKWSPIVINKIMCLIPNIDYILKIDIVFSIPNKSIP